MEFISVGYESTNTSLIGLFYKNLGRVWMVSDCEELSWEILTGDDCGVVCVNN
jgi:hypothetical protein